MRVLALDVGSSSTRACAYDERGRELGEPARRAYEARHGRDGSAELDADELVRRCEAVLAEAGGGHDATGISCFWHSLLLLDERDRPLTPVLLWQDRRSAAQAEELRGAARPGARCTTAPAASCTRASGRRSSPGCGSRARSTQARRVVSFADYLFLRLTGELRTTLSTASGSGLLDLRARAWDGELLDALGLDEQLLPPISRRARPARPYPPLGDGACSNLGAGCTTPERAALMIGTSGAYRVLHEGEPEPARRALLLLRRRAAAWSRAARSPTAATSSRGSSGRSASRQLEPREPDGHGLTFLPLLGGERSPGWNPRGHRRDRRAHLRRRRGRPAAGRARGRRLPDRGDRRRAARGARGGRDRARAARETSGGSSSSPTCSAGR